MNQLSSRDVEQLSAYLDGQLSQADSARLESRIKSDPELQSVYDGLRQSRALLRRLPMRRAPRNFRLTPNMAGVKPPLPRSFPFFRLASALASILFFLGYALNLSAPAAPTPTAIGMPYGAGGGLAPDAELAIQEFAAETMAPEPIDLPPSAKAVPTEGPLPEEPEPTSLNPYSTGTDEDNATTLMAPEFTPDLRTAQDAYNTSPALSPPPPALPVHPAWLFGLLGLAVVTGAGAFAVRLKTEREWRKANAAGPVRLGTRDILLVILAIGAVLLFAAGVYWMATAYFYVPPFP